MATETGEPHALPTTEDAFLGGQLMIAQALQGSRAGIDAVFLAAACPVRPGERVLDAGAGSGVVGLAVARRVEGARVTGVEIDPELCALASANAARNGLADRAGYLCADMTSPPGRLFEAGLAPDSFDHAVANPPFLDAAGARLPSAPMLRRAHALETGDLERWIKSLGALVKPKGTLTLVHRADALARILRHCEGRFGGLIVYPLYPREGEPACRVLIHGRKGSRAPLRLARGMVLHHAGNGFVREAEAILRDGASLELGRSK
ncbi:MULTISPECIES: methyltransferase domain-containing protein [Rhodomicrobium]|uniref:tRNA1(Val) (adenine(37)-N6)-methyltransferase n=1 Tax=Rhodomicrobium TaxID=1068 RepID=UPI000B4B42F6|nr:MULTISPECIES: methyltransferase domain-containing protein [Rhodomicrobium]